MSIKAQIIADSLNPAGKRLTTFIIDFPRIVLAELNTHRALSKNSASSRAIPFETMLSMVTQNPFVPIRFQKEHKGMQGTEYYEGEEHEQCTADWLAGRDAAAKAALNFKFPVTKQLRNRMLEAYLWHKVIVSATDYENFFALRFHGDAEIHIANLAQRMLIEYNASTPKKLNADEWHIPFGDQFDEAKINDILSEEAGVNLEGSEKEDYYIKARAEVCKKIAVARCARISYLNYEGKDDYRADIKLCDRLFANNPKHLSPTEHVAQALNDDSQSGNFSGFKQFRKFFADENLKDPRVLKK